MKFTTSTAKNLFIKALRFAVSPITVQPAFFVLLFVLLGIPDIYSVAVFHSLVPLFKVVSTLFLCYIFTIPVIVLPTLLRRYYKVTLLLFASIFFAVDIYLLLLYNDTFGTISKDAISAVLATNPSESAEFINSYFTIERSLLVLAFISVPISLFYFARKVSVGWNNYFISVLMMLLLASAAMTLQRFDKVKDSNLYYLLTKECPDLREYRQNPIVVHNGKSVDNVIFVIGESFSKFHSSLYGYEKETNPKLKKLKNDSALFVYENITSACVATIPSIKSIMMAYTKATVDSVEWYRCLTLIEVMQNRGYKTYWFSNQSKTGFHDNEVGRFADLCDEQCFVGDKHSGLNRENKDEELLPMVEECLSDTCLPKFVIVQLMGSHAGYSNRYPREFAKFNSNCYKETHSHLSTDNRLTVAEYDNSVLYNDSVVYELMKKFENKNAVVIYLSDHGEDVFRSSDDFCGHAAELDEHHWNIVQQIPMMVYTSPFFREKHPELQQRIENAVNRPYRTDSVMYSIMDIVGVETVNGVSYKHKSLFK